MEQNTKTRYRICKSSYESAACTIEKATEKPDHDVNSQTPSKYNALTEIKCSASSESDLCVQTDILQH